MKLGRNKENIGPGAYLKVDEERSPPLKEHLQCFLSK